MLKVLADGEDRHRLENAAGRTVGSIRGRAVRLRGLPSEGVAMAATIVAWEALDAALASQIAGWKRHRPHTDDLRLVHDGAHLWITDGRKPLARLIRPTPTPGAERTFAIEFVLPSYANEGLAISAAHAMITALDRVLDAAASGASEELALSDGPPAA